MKKNANFYAEIKNMFSSQLKNAIFKYENSSNNKIIYFYEDCMIIIYTNRIVKYLYNKITYINENNNSFLISIKSENLKIDKKDLNEKNIQFLKIITRDYKNIEDNSGSGNHEWESIELKNKNSINCLDAINENSINQYYTNKRVKFDIFFNYYFLHVIEAFILIFILWFPLHLYSISSLKPIHILILVPCAIFVGDLIKMKKYIEINTIESLKLENKIQLFFFKDIFVIKSPDLITCYKYKNMKIIFETNEFLFIKFKFLPTLFGKKSVFYPLILKKNIIKKSDFDFIYNLLKK